MMMILFLRFLSFFAEKTKTEPKLLLLLTLFENIKILLPFHNQAEAANI